MSETKKITVNVAGKNYPLLINPSEEKEVKEMETYLKKKYLSISSEYPKLEIKDHLAMMLLEMGMKYYKQGFSDKENHSTGLVDSIIKKIENSLD